MSRKKVEINPESGKRLSLLLKGRGMQQKELAETLGYTPQQISRIITGKDRLTEDFAHKVVELFKPKNDETGSIFLDLDTVRYEWLMCYSDFKTGREVIQSIANEKHEINALITRLMKLCGYEIVQKAFSENIKKYVLTSYRKDDETKSVILDDSDVGRLFTDIADFVEFSCHKRLKFIFQDYLEEL